MEMAKWLAEHFQKGMIFDVKKKKKRQPTNLYLCRHSLVFYVLFILWMNWSPAAISSSNTNWVVERAGLG
jgi:hypothetical protein